MSDIIRHLIIRGKVQGVGYRAWIAEQAAASNIAGWTRNRRDSSVEAVLAGPEDAVIAIVKKCQHGPGMARVSCIDDEPAGEDMLNLRATGETFSVLATV